MSATPSARCAGKRRKRKANHKFSGLNPSFPAGTGSDLWLQGKQPGAAAGAVGVVRRDPMAMLPFCGYNMADYWQHWIDIGATLDPDKAPKIFNVNWFRKDDEGNFMWPGFGDNLRVLEWIIKRCEGKVDAQETAIGYIPYAKDINIEGLEGEVSLESLEKILDVDKNLWEEEANGIEEFFKKFGDKLPKELKESLETLKANLK